MHYSFDFAQQVHIPSNPMQPGPIYFKTPRKCAIFGVMCEAIPRHVNYLIDEASDVSKGANTTISYVHHFFEHYGLGETSVHLHADNCAGSVLIFDRWAHKAWSQSMFRHNQEIIELTTYHRCMNSPTWWSRPLLVSTRPNLLEHTMELLSSQFTIGLPFLDSFSKGCRT